MWAEIFSCTCSVCTYAYSNMFLRETDIVVVWFGVSFCSNFFWQCFRLYIYIYGFRKCKFLGVGGECNIYETETKAAMLMSRILDLLMFCQLWYEFNCVPKGELLLNKCLPRLHIDIVIHSLYLTLVFVLIQFSDSSLLAVSVMTYCLRFKLYRTKEISKVVAMNKNTSNLRNQASLVFSIHTFEAAHDPKRNKLTTQLNVT